MYAIFADHTWSIFCGSYCDLLQRESESFGRENDPNVEEHSVFNAHCVERTYFEHLR